MKSLKGSEKKEDKREYDAVYEIKHCKDDIFETSEKVKKILGKINNIVVFERESFETLEESF